ncbi:hypothetical protein D9M70_631720 [compost metagenome]
MDQPGYLSTNGFAVFTVEMLAHVHRVAPVDEFDVALVLLHHGAGHAPEVAIFQVERPGGIDVVAADKRLPESFIMGA